MKIVVDLMPIKRHTVFSGDEHHEEKPAPSAQAKRDQNVHHRLVRVRPRHHRLIRVLHGVRRGKRGARILYRFLDATRLADRHGTHGSSGGDVDDLRGVDDLIACQPSDVTGCPGCHRAIIHAGIRHCHGTDRSGGSSRCEGAFHATIQGMKRGGGRKRPLVKNNRKKINKKEHHFS